MTDFNPLPCPDCGLQMKMSVTGVCYECGGRLYGPQEPDMVKFGFRGPGTAIFEPQEWGYRCPFGHANITWSEYKDHIWCWDCKDDYHYALHCVLVEDKYNPGGLPLQPRIVKGVKNYTPDGNDFNDIPEELLNTT